MTTYRITLDPEAFAGPSPGWWIERQSKYGVWYRIGARPFACREDASKTLLQTTGVVI